MNENNNDVKFNVFEVKYKIIMLIGASIKDETIDMAIITARQMATILCLDVETVEEILVSMEKEDMTLRERDGFYGVMP